MNVTVADMKANLADILRRAAEGEEVRVTLDGRPYVRIAADADRSTEATLPPAGALPRIGALRGRIRIADDFDALGPEWDEYMR